jgi:ubiquinone/menaquinone biosynthesis C-methylase UbiE
MAELDTHDHVDHEPHDWHSPDYVQEWINEDISDDLGRLPLFAHMFAQAPFSSTAPLRILDVGGGHGVLSEAALAAFPNARVTLLDFSLAMIEQARRRLAPSADRMTFLLCDLACREWSHNFHGSFDLAVSSFAIHNLEEPMLVATAFTSISQVLQPRGAFVNHDFVQFSGGLEPHLAWLEDAGFSRVSVSHFDPNAPIMIGIKD